MKFGFFYEHQVPRPWDRDTERRALHNALEQIELADRLGVDYVWEVEHHFLEEYSHSSAPEVFLGAASQRTKDIRLGHGIVQAPTEVNHPARTAERVATLDLLSNGRVDFGTGEGSTAVELGGFDVDWDTKRQQWHEVVDAITRMFVEDPFAGYDGEFLQMPPRNVVPKPLQQPHPPLWVACTRQDTIRMAAQNGIGALAFSFVNPDEAKRWIDEYYAIVASEACVPAGFAVNPNLAVVLPFMCHSDEEEAIERGIDGAHWFGYTLFHYVAFGHHRPAVTNLTEEFFANRAARGFERTATVGERLVGATPAGGGSLRGAIGTPDQLADLIRQYEAVGVDQMIFAAQAGTNRHEHVCEAIELFATTVMPEFKERDEAHVARKQQRLEDAVGQALLRRSPRRQSPQDYTIAPAGRA